MKIDPMTPLPILSLRSRRFLLSIYASIFLARNAGRRLVIACEMTLRFSPQPRQNFGSSLFCMPHFGQYISNLISVRNNTHLNCKHVYRSYVAFEMTEI